MSSSGQMSEPAQASGWIPVRQDKTGLLPIKDGQTRAQKRQAARQSKLPAKRLHKHGPEVHKIIQAATSTEQDNPEPHDSSSSSDDARRPVIARPTLKQETDQAKLAALVAARDCKKCQWNSKGLKGCGQCMGWFYQVMRLTKYNLPALQAKLQQEQDK